MLVKIVVVADGDAPVFKNSRLLVDSSLTMSQFLYKLRKRLKLRSDEAVYLFVNNTLPMMSMSVGEVHAKHAVKGILTVHYGIESAFGSGNTSFRLQRGSRL